VPVLSFTFTTSSSFPPAPFFVVVAFEEPFLFIFFISLRLLNAFLAGFALDPFLVGSVSIFAWRRALLAARADKRLAVEVSDADADGEGGDCFSRENVTDRVFFFPFSPSLLDALRGLESWALWDKSFIGCCEIEIIEDRGTEEGSVSDMNNE